MKASIFFSVSWLWSFIWSVKPLERPITNLCGYISPVWTLKHSFVRFNQTQTCFQNSAFLCPGATAPQLVQLTWWNAAGAWVWFISGPFPVCHSPNADGFQVVFMPMQSTVFALYVDCLPAHNQISNMIGQHSKQKKARHYRHNISMIYKTVHWHYFRSRQTFGDATCSMHVILEEIRCFIQE